MVPNEYSATPPADDDNWARFQTCWELYARNPIPYNGLQLHDAAYTCIGAGMKLERRAPILAAISILMDCCGPLGLMFAEFFPWLCRRVLWRGRPMWNDFEMGRYLLTKDPHFVGTIYRQIHSGRRPCIEEQPDGDAENVWLTGHWMVNSTAENNPQFRADWSAYVLGYGETGCAQCFERARALRELQSSDAAFQAAAAAWRAAHYVPAGGDAA